MGKDYVINLLKIQEIKVKNEYMFTNTKERLVLARELRLIKKTIKELKEVL